jgi:hypothetical protein
VNCSGGLWLCVLLSQSKVLITSSSDFAAIIFEPQKEGNCHSKCFEKQRKRKLNGADKRGIFIALPAQCLGSYHPRESQEEGARKKVAIEKFLFTPRTDIAFAFFSPFAGLRGVN